MKKILLLITAVAFCPIIAFSQKIEFTLEFIQLLEQAQIEIFEPTDAGYKDFAPAENEFQNSHFAIRSNKEDLDIRYVVIPWDEADPRSTNPHIRTFAALSNVATNEDEAIVSAIRPTKETLRKDFNADWGMTYFFTPKEAFSTKKNCRMVALCKEGQGTVLVFYLFNDVENEALDTRYYSLRFL